MRRNRVIRLLLLSLVLFLCGYAATAAGLQPTVGYCRPDVNLDGEIDLFDLAIVGRMYGLRLPLGSQEDTNGDGSMDIFDLVCVAYNMRPCRCEPNYYNCNDFSSRFAAQVCYNYCMRIKGYDVHLLDVDGDGYVCEWSIYDGR